MGGERGGERLAGEVRMSPGRGEAAHVGDGIDRVRLEQSQDVL